MGLSCTTLGQAALPCGCRLSTYRAWNWFVWHCRMGMGLSCTTLCWGCRLANSMASSWNCGILEWGWSQVAPNSHCRLAIHSATALLKSWQCNFKLRRERIEATANRKRSKQHWEKTCNWAALGLVIRFLSELLLSPAAKPGPGLPLRPLQFFDRAIVCNLQFTEMLLQMQKDTSIFMSHCSWFSCIGLSVVGCSSPNVSPSSGSCTGLICEGNKCIATPSSFKVPL